MEVADEREAQEVELQAWSSHRAIAGVAIPAVVLNAAPPLVVAVQTALVGRFASTEALAAFAATGTCVAFVSRSANFLIDGVSSKVGRSVGQRDWGSLDTHIQLSLRWSLLLGAAAVPLLLASRTPLLAWLLALAPEVQAVAAGYWLVRSAAVPLQLLCMSAAGVLQGFGRVRVNAALASGAAVLEMLGSALVLRLHAAGPQPSLEAASLETSSSSSSSNLVWLGCVTLACQLVLAAASLSCIALLPPAEARVSLRQVLFSRGGGSSSSSIEASQPAGPEQPLLDDGEGRPGDAPIYGSEAMTGRAAWLDRATLEFLRDGLNMFLRTMVLQLTFFLALASAARLGTTALAAHSIIGQLWVVISYGVDGFAAAGIVLGSRLTGLARDEQLRPSAKRHMCRLISRTLWAGGLSGAAAGAAFWAAAASMPSWFTSDAAVVDALRAGGAWAVLCASQPLNGLLFVADGLMYATQAFKFVRDYMALGFLLVFAPALALQAWLHPSLAGIWLAKAALNVWRLGGAAYLIYWRFLPRFGLEERGGPQRRHGDERQEEGGAGHEA